MSERSDKVQELFEDVRRTRDELRVKIHLAKAEARDEWHELEKKWDHFKARAERAGEAAEDAAEDVGEALELVGEELHKGYRRIRDAL